ncbi:MAG: aminoglycoside phosphotransferase family protein, partial [Aggregatilineales bacterium]
MTDTLQYYLAKWELTAPEQLAETFTSTVYTVQQNDRTVVLKILNLVGVEDEQNGAAALQHFAGHGAVKLLNADTNAHLLEYVPGVDLLPMVQRN